MNAIPEINELKNEENIKFENVMSSLEKGIELKRNSNKHFNNQNFLEARDGYLNVNIF